MFSLSVVVFFLEMILRSLQQCRIPSALERLYVPLTENRKLVRKEVDLVEAEWLNL